jgi:hypothetical protein
MSLQQLCRRVAKSLLSRKINNLCLLLKVFFNLLHRNQGRQFNTRENFSRKFINTSPCVNWLLHADRGESGRPAGCPFRPKHSGL